MNQKVTKILPGLLSIWAGLASMPVMAQDGAGVRGGGHVIDVNGTPELIEMVKGAVCDWKTGDQIIQKNPAILKTLSRLERYDWYFSSSIEQSIRYLKYCFTGPLLRISPLDRRSPVATELMKFGKYRQAAVRLGSSVFVDESIYRQMLAQSPERAANLMIHEALHSFFEMNLMNRYLYLWTMSKDIALAGQAPVDSREGLYREMDANHVDFPQTVEYLMPYRAQVSFLIGTKETKMAAVLASAHPEDLIRDVDHFVPYLADPHQEYIQEYGPERILSAVIAVILREGSLQEFDAILKKKYDRITPLAIALSVMDKMSAEKKAKLFGTGMTQNGLEAAFAHLKTLEVKKGDLRIMASSELSFLLGGQSIGEFPLTDLPQTIQKNLDLEIIIQVISKMIQEDRWDRISQLTQPGSSFYRALSLQSQQEAIGMMAPTVATEKALAIRFLKSAGKKLLQVVLDGVKSKVTSEQYQRLNSMIQGNEI